MADWTHDWYQSTVHGSDADTVIRALVEAADLAGTRPAIGRHGYQRGSEVHRGSNVLARVWWGGQPGIHVQVSGSEAPWGHAALRRFDQRITRVDSRMDWVEPGLFDHLSAKLLDYARTNRVKIDQRGDWSRGQARTLYLGSKSSTAQIVLYEKGYESGGDPNWVRLEVRLYPKGQAGYRVAFMSAADVPGCSPMVTRALSAIGIDVLAHRSVGTVWKPSDTDRARLAIVRQYRAILRNWADDVGSWAALGHALRDACEADAASSEPEAIPF